MALVPPRAIVEDAIAVEKKPGALENAMIAAIADQPTQPETLQRVTATPTVASLAGVSKNYDAVKALVSVDFNVRAGEVVALLGPNGAGKTTAVKLLLGLMTPNSGKVQVFGADPTNPDNR
jgi:ABC-type uncharacterized transport system ATPase subunit